VKNHTPNELTIVIPVFNEEQAIPGFVPVLLQYASEYEWQIIFVDDASTDESSARLECFCDGVQVALVRHKVNRGYGGALKTGIRMTETKFVLTMDGDGQHHPKDATKLFEAIRDQNADMVIGCRSNNPAGFYRAVGRRLIRWVAGLLMPITIQDLNSGMKAYKTTYAQRYISLCPDGMAFSDVITLVFINRGRLVVEEDIDVRPRISGNSTVKTMTASDTVLEIINIVALFNPSKIFLPTGLVFIVFGLVWGLPVILRDEGISVGTMLLLISGLIFFLMGLVAEQISMIRRGQIDEKD